MMVHSRVYLSQPTVRKLHIVLMVKAQHIAAALSIVILTLLSPLTILFPQGLAPILRSILLNTWIHRVWVIIISTITLLVVLFQPGLVSVHLGGELVKIILILNPAVIMERTTQILQNLPVPIYLLVLAVTIMFTMTDDPLIYTIVMEEPGAISLEAVSLIIIAIRTGLALPPSVLVSARTTTIPVRSVFPEADEKAAAMVTTRAVSVACIIQIRCGDVASMIILNKIRDRSGSTLYVYYLNSH